VSAKALATRSFAPAAERTVASDHPAPESQATEIQFREDLWREYRREAINAGLSAAQATDYASALSPEIGMIGGVSASAPVGRDWFYQSRTCVVERTIASGLITLGAWEQSKNTRRTTAAIASIVARWLRPWNAGKKG
jgi:hypothetical protein